MLGYIEGKVISISDNGVLLLCGGIGFEVAVTTTCLTQLDIGGDIALYTHLAVRDDGMYLFGFLNKDEKNMFLQLITVSGVGPKVAMSILSAMDLKTLAMSIITGDSKALSKIKGIGKKTAERIILELKESVEPFDSDVIEGFKPKTESKDTLDAILALRSLGISQSDAVRAVKSVEDRASSIEELITFALKAL